MRRATACPTMNTLSTLVRISSPASRPAASPWNGAAALHAGVVDEDVDAADLGLDGVDAGVHRAASVTSKARA